MSEALFAQLIEAPSPDAYLVFADALQQRDDPWGELIALSVRAEQTGEPPGSRQRALEAELGQKVLGEVTGIELVWKSGFVDELTFVAGAVNAAHTAGIYERPELALTTSVRIRRDLSSKPRDASIVRLVASAFARNLRRFELVGARRPLQASTLAAVLSSCPRLLDLTWSARDLDFEILERHPRLERLAFWDSVTAEQLDRLVRGPWPLRALGYRAQVPAPLVPASIAEIVAGTGFPALTELAISNGGFDPALIEALVGSRLADRLTVLALDWGRVTNEALAAARGTLARTRLGSPRPSTDPVEVANAYRLSARYREGLGRPREALPHAELATSTDPDHYYSWCELGYVHDALHQDDAVVRAIDRAITIEPERPNARYWRADALVHLRRFAEAEQDLLFALPRDAAMAGYIHGRLGRLYARWNRSDDARAAYIRAIADSARDVDQRGYTSSLVREMLEVGEIAAATTALAYQNEHFPADRPRELDGIVAFAEGNFARAAGIARAIPAGVSGEGCFSWYLLESASLRELGRLDEANARYQQIIDTADCPAWIAHCWLGQTLLGADPFAAIGGATPHEIDDQVAAAVRTETHAVHDTRTHPADRFQVTICAIAADLLCGRATAARVTAFEAECRAAVRAPGPWDSTSMIVRITRARLAESDGALLRRIYALASGHA